MRNLITVRNTITLLFILWSLPCFSWAADNYTVLDSTRSTVTFGSKDIGGVEYPTKTLVDESGAGITKWDYWGIGVILHEHDGHGDIHFHDPNVTGDNTYILVDISDNTNYPHGASAVSLHLDAMHYQINASGTAEYKIEFYYIENCDATDCDSYMFDSIAGDKSSGNNYNESTPWSGSGPLLQTGSGGTKVSSNMITLNNTTYNTATTYKSTHNFAAAATAAGNNDLIMVVDHTAGTFSLRINLSYHSHDATHP